jgi:transcriptional regulator with XRE-family HTH domain
MMIAQDVKDLRKRLGWSQQRFATEIGVAVTTVSRWERGISSPFPIALEKIKSLARERGMELPEG